MRVFLREQQGLELAGGAGGRSLSRALVPLSELSRWERFRADATRIDWVPDLGAEIGSRAWWRGLATCVSLIAATWALSPGLDRPIVGAVPAPLTGAAFEEARSSAVLPLGLGAGTGRRMGANDLVAPLAETPERPVIELDATFGDGDRFARLLQRAGVSRADAAAAAELVARDVDPDELAPGTRIKLTLGRRSSRKVARPLESLALRARFDLNLALRRDGPRLVAERRPIAIDRTPLRIQGLVGSSLYRSARAAGAPARLVDAFIKAIATRVSIGRVHAADSFDLVAEQARAATGEVQVGALQLAALDQGRTKVRLVRWGDGDGTWWDANGQSERRGTMGMPVAGRVTSSYGFRVHPLLGYLRMHKGIDLAAPRGAPIYAAMDGVVTLAGRNAGYGNFVKLNHAGGLATGYGHMSRIAVRGGARVRQGQVIGYVGSTGMSTGPHLHWEVWRGGKSINPRGISWSSVATLSGEALRRFKAKVSGLLAVTPGVR